METLERPCSPRDGYEGVAAIEVGVSESQKASAQIKESCSFLASKPPGGTAPDSVQECRRFPLHAFDPSLNTSDVNVQHLPAASVKNASCLIGVSRRDAGLHMKSDAALVYLSPLGDSKKTLKWNASVCLWFLVAVLACLSSVALAFCVHLHSKVKDQSEVVETLLEDYRNLHEELDTTKNFLQNQHTTSSTAGKGVDFPENNYGDLEFLGLEEHLPPRLLELLKIHKRRKRYAQHGSANSRGPTDEEVRFWREVQRIVRTEVGRHHENIPRVHLKGMSSGSTEYLDQTNQYLLWQQDPASFQRRGVRLKYVHHQHNKVKAIEIQQSGVYLIYSQVVINGSNATSYRRDCTHETVVLAYHDDNNRDDVPSPEPHVLMRGYLTQDGEGLAYNTSSLLYPRDSTLQMGLFRLLRQSQVKVRIPYDDEDCRHVNFHTDFHASYFGLYKIT